MFVFDCYVLCFVSTDIAFNFNFACLLLPNKLQEKEPLTNVNTADILIIFRMKVNRDEKLNQQCKTWTDLVDTNTYIYGLAALEAVA